MEKTSSLSRETVTRRPSRKQPTTATKPVADALSLDRLQSLVASFVIVADIERHSPRTIGNKRERLSRLVWLAEQKQWQAVGVRELQAFFVYLRNGHTEPGGRWGQGGVRGAKPTSSGTAKTFHATYRAFFRWCVKENELTVCPMDKINPPIDRPSQVQPFSPEQVLALEVAAKKSQNPCRDEAIHNLLLDTGLRVSELCDLRLADIDFDGGQVRVRHGKGDKERFVPFGRSAKRALWNYRERERRHADKTEPVFLSERGIGAGAYALSARSVALLVARMGKRAKLPQTVRCSPHTYRHTFAVMSLRNGANIFSLKQWLGHESLTMVNRYLALSQADSLAAHRLSSPADRLKDAKGGR